MPATTTRKKSTTKRTPAVKPVSAPSPQVELTPEPVAQTNTEVTSNDDNWVLVSLPIFAERVRYESFYDGHLTVYDGVAYVPKANPHWVARLLFSGYQWKNPEDAEVYERSL